MKHQGLHREGLVDSCEAAKSPHVPRWHAGTVLACQDIRNRQAAIVAAQGSEQSVDIRTVAATGQRICQHFSDYTCLLRIATIQRS